MGLISWLGFGNTKRDKMIADYLSDIAVAVIGEGDKLEASHDYKVSDTFDKIKKNSDELDHLFTQHLMSVSCDYGTTDFNITAQEVSRL